MAGAEHGAGDAPVVFFDLETTDRFTRTSETLQIAAKNGLRTFNVYILPRGDIHPEAGKVNGFSKLNKELLKNGTAVDAVELEDALQGFLQFLKEIETQVILVAHNGYQFDAPILLRDMKQSGLMDSFLEAVYGFADSVPFLERKLPQWRIHRLADLAKHFGVDAVNAHDGAEDVRILAEIVQKAGITDDEIRKGVKTVAQTVLGGVTKFGKRYGLELLKRWISESMLRSLAESVITIDVLELSAMSSEQTAFARLVNESDVNSENIERLKDAVWLAISAPKYR